jgi:hypothetical protein
MIPSYLYKVSFPTGSNYICNPPVTNTDVDEMFLVDDLQEVNFQLTGLGWKKCGLEEETYQDTPSHWAAYRKENMNALLTTNLKYFMDFFKATEEAKHLNLLNKEDRVALFQKILGEEPKKKKIQLDLDYLQEFIRPVMNERLRNPRAQPTAEQIREFWRADGLA